MLYLSATVRISFMFAIDTGCPPEELQVTVRTINGTFSAPYSFIVFSSFSIFTFPLKGWSISVSKASSIVQSIAFAFLNSIWPFVVSKCEFPGIISPSFIVAENKTFSAALPWCVARK